MPGESKDQPQAAPSQAEPSLNVSRAQAETQEEVVPQVTLERPRSWIEKIFQLVSVSGCLDITPSEVVPVSVLAVQRYLLVDKPTYRVPKPTLYCYDVTISDGVCKEKCYLDPSLNFLVYQNILKVGIEMKIFRVSCFYETRVEQGMLCLQSVCCGETLDVVSVENPFRNEDHAQKPERPLRGWRSHYLALWNNEDPHGDVWLNNKCAKECDLNNVKIIDLSLLEMMWNKRNNFPALLVRIVYKSKLQYYGKPGKKMIEPYQAYLEVADNSGMMSVILWNDLCPEWYKSLRVGLVLLLQDYSVKKSYPFRVQPTPADPAMKQISTVEIWLNVYDPVANITIIPEKQLGIEWGLPKLSYQFITRSELNDAPEGTICDVVGLLSFVGRVQRSQKTEYCQEYCSYRWIHIFDGTSELPFIVELFSTSQPEIFETICPMMYFVCTQLKVVRKDTQVPKLLYLTTTNESQVYVIGNEYQPYAHDKKVKNFIQWIKAKNHSEEVKKTVIGGYYPYPPVPEKFCKYSFTVKGRSLLTDISEVESAIKALQYREQKRIAIQGIITAIKYIPHNCPSESASATEMLWSVDQPSISQAAPDESHQLNRCGSKRNQDDRPMWYQCFSTTSKSPSKKIKFTEDPCSNLVAEPQAYSCEEVEIQRPCFLLTFLENPILFKTLPSIDHHESWCPFGGALVHTLKIELTPVHNETRQENSFDSALQNTIRIINNKWESKLWIEERLSLRNHLKYSHVHPESIPRQFAPEHGKFLTQQCNSQPSKYVPPEGRPPKLSEFKSARSLGHFEVSILGQEQVAIDVAFLPMYCLEDVRTSQIDTLLSCMSYSCVHPQDVAVNEQLPDLSELADDIIKAAAELDRIPIIGILDVCNLGGNDVEVYLQKIYTPVDSV